MSKVFYYDTEKDKELFKKLFLDLIVIEGSDGSGKATQANKLMWYIDKGTNIYPYLLDFPDYGSDTGKLITAMLHGKFGEDAAELNPYFTSPMYGLDRYQYFQKVANGSPYKPAVGICNRYTMSNLIHQGARLSNEDLISYWSWLYDFEFNHLGLPKPTITIYLEVPYEVSYENVVKRAEENHITLDINEKKSYLKMVSDHLQRLKTLVDWKFINCYDEEKGEMRSIDAIHRDVKKAIYEAHSTISHLFFQYDE